MKVHFIGICGTAMSAVACMMQDQGHEVYGSDVNAYPPVGPFLEKRGIPILKGFSGENIVYGPDMVIVGNVARKDNPEVVAAVASKIPMFSMPQAIRRFFIGDRTSLVIAGTHGKTSVTSMVSWILEHAGLDPTYLVGGIPQNFGSNYKFGKGDHFVIEGDEYDTAFFDKKAKFFHYNPTFTALTSLEFDHADIYPDFATIKATFEEYAATVNPEGVLAYCADYPVLHEVVTHSKAPVISFGLSPHADLRAEGVVSGPFGTSFDLVEGRTRLGKVTTDLSGRHNVLNSLAAVAVTRAAGLDISAIISGLATYKGVMRRFQVVGSEAGVTVIDDFAHHPTAVRETIAAARQRFPVGRVFAAYHFESNTSRRKVFEYEYGRAFDDADYVFLTYPLRKNDALNESQYLDPNAVLEEVKEHARGAWVHKDMGELADGVAALVRPGDVVLGMSGRDFTPFYQSLLGQLRTRSSRTGELPTATDSRVY